MNENRFPMLIPTIGVLCLYLMALGTHRLTEKRLSRIEAKQDAILQTLLIVTVQLPEETE